MIDVVNDNAINKMTTDGAHPHWLTAVRARTPARILVGRAGSAYSTPTQLELRRDHAAALDAVHAELEATFVERCGLFLVQTQATDRAEFLARPLVKLHCGRLTRSFPQWSSRDRHPRSF